MFFSSVKEGIKLIFSGNPELYMIIGRTLFVSLSAVCIAGLIGIPLGISLGLREFPGKTWVTRILYVFMGLPPVFVGLIVFILLSRSSPIGRRIYLLFTPAAMIIAQAILALPIITGLIMTAVEEKAEPIILTSKGLGANALQIKLTLLTELKISFIAGVVAALGRVIAEVGAVTLVGGDIEGYTRVLTTAIVLETRKGHFQLALALGLILLFISFLINTALYHWQYRR
ncbi:MAG TPA: ABC transporter permease [Firmicutes bacterium]|nr:ABC transporter permease [Bacillota bacterium]